MTLRHLTRKQTQSDYNYADRGSGRYRYVCGCVCVFFVFCFVFVFLLFFFLGGEGIIQMKRAGVYPIRSFIKREELSTPYQVE